MDLYEYTVPFSLKWIALLGTQVNKTEIWASPKNIRPNGCQLRFSLEFILSRNQTRTGAAGRVMRFASNGCYVQWPHTF